MKFTCFSLQKLEVLYLLITWHFRSWEEDSDENGEKLEALLDVVNSNDNNHIVHIPWYA
jgi:hypothetical protein